MIVKNRPQRYKKNPKVENRKYKFIKKTPKIHSLYIKMYVRACEYEKKVVPLFPKLKGITNVHSHNG